ncbi:MAG TPA: CotH kinase family protein [Chthoniobacteraceae bacterium]|nr:CotH kinase family protein [Chthoniobacteraceae bacterium]
MNPHPRMVRAAPLLRTLLLVALLGSICPLFAAEPTRDTLNAGQDLFDSNRVVKIDITLPAADWDKLRNQERDIAAEFGKERLESATKSSYTWFSADIRIDDTQFKNVGIRKRGLIGSADKERPGLNIQLDRFEKGHRLGNHTALKLHNNKQDASNVRQALAYQLFNAAGVAAPRCNLAVVTVNGQKLGVYSNIEAIDAPFLTQHFKGASGNLYEAQISDFRPGWTRTFEKKNNEEAKRDDLDAVAKALDSSDADLLTELGRVLDIDSFISFWAMESLINHWDGFSGDLNNAFVYHSPTSGKLHFIPWGTDGTFGTHHIFVPFDPPASVWAVSYLSRRLYNHPVTQKKYRARMEELLKTVWNEERLLAEVDRMLKLADGFSTIPPLLAAGPTEQLRQFIRTRRSEIEPELKQPAQPWLYPMRREVYSVPVAKVSAEFSASWVPHVFIPAMAGSKAKVTLDFYGRQYAGEFTDVKGAPDITNPQNATVLLTGSFKGVEVPVSIWMSVHTNFFSSGKKLEDAGTQAGILLVAGQFGTKDWRMLASSYGGTTRLTKAERKPGAKVEGVIESELNNIPWEDFDLSKLKKSQ